MKFVVLLSLLVSLASSCSVVGPGQKAVHTVFGNPSGEMGSGFTLWLPIVYGIEKFDLRVQKQVIETTAASKDMQPLDTHIAVNWRIDPKDLTGFYKDVGTTGDAERKILEPAVNEVVKAATAKLTAEEVISRRIELKKDIDEKLQERLTRYGLRADDVSIVDISFSPEFTKAIEQKQIAEQQTKQAEYQAQKAVKDAEGRVNAARGEAESQVVLAKAQAEGQRLLQTSLTPQMLQKLALDKWNGQFPQVLGNQALPFLNLTPKGAKASE